ncbi:dentin sialophosphoprotein-like isoform X3 [Trifolium pratense]|uniref:dentin sialophosphoprotein-like isoform X3 n=1 Tax=Trifolium pratense TaxID=57577 RepID=UPI001E690533|nr:dentin sialophosphoprotein-like isoform X3 [Trifolium pratense]
MGKEMGNNNTSAIKEEDNISEADKKNLLEDTSEHANEISQKENQNLTTSLSKDVVENGSNIYSDTTIELGKDGHDADDNVEEKIQTISIAESNDADEKASMIESDYSLEEDTHASEINMENQMHQKSEEEVFKEKSIGLASEHATMELGNVSVQEERCGDDVKDESQMIPIAEAKDVEEKEATRLVSHDIESKNENNSLEEGDTHESEINMENQMHPIDEDVEEKATTEVGKVSMQEECCGDDVNEKTQMILIDEAKDVEEKGIKLVSHNVERKVENDSLEGDANESDINMENQMHPKPEEEGVEEKATTELGKVSMQEECRGDEVKDVEEKATGLTSHNISSKLENDTLEGDANVSDISMENQMHRKSEDGKEKATTERGKVSMQEEGRSDDVKEKIQMIPTDEAKHVEEKVTGLISYNVESKPENDTLEGDNHESDINMENQMHPIDETEGVEEKAIVMVSDHTRSSLQNDLLKDKDDLEIAAGLSYDGETSELEDEDKKDGNTIIPFMNGIDFQGKTTILASDDPLFLRNSFGGEGEEMVQVIQPEKSPYSESVEGENCESLPSSSFESNEEYEKQEDSCLRRNPSVTYNHNLNDESSIKQDEGETSVLTLNAANASNDSELQELLQGNESLLKDTLPNADSHFQQIKHDGSEKDMEYQEKLLCENKSDERDENEFVNNTIDTSENNNIEDSINSNHEENCKVLNEENKFSRSGSTNENPRDCKQDQCIVELKESNGDCNGETHTILDSSIFGIANNDQIEEDNVTENGFLFDAYVSNSIKVSDENASPEEEKSVVPEVEESTVVAETNMLEQCSSDMITINQEETFSLQNSSSLLHIYSYNHGNVEQTESFTVASMPKSDEEAIEKEREEYSQHAEATSLIVEELTTSIELSSNSSLFANGGYETRDSVTRLSTESNPDDKNITCHMQKSPSFNLNLRIEAKQEESDQIPLLRESANDSLSNKASLNLSNSMPHDEYDHIEEKIVTMERSYSEVSKSSFIGFLKEEEEARLLVMEQTQDNNVGSKVEVKVVSSSTSPKGKDRRNFRSFFFTNCMCCATVPN